MCYLYLAYFKKEVNIILHSSLIGDILVSESLYIDGYK